MRTRFFTGARRLALLALIITLTMTSSLSLTAAQGQALIDAVNAAKTDIGC